MPARYRESEAKTVCRPARVVDPWFVSQYGMNLYCGCEHACLYCDGRAEKYRVEGDFAADIVVKRNAPTVLRREISRIREPGFVFLGGGVCDAYQPAEATFGLARQALELLDRFAFPVHVLTKSTLVQRDFDLLDGIRDKTRVILSFSIQTTDDAIRERFEPGAAPIEERFRVLRDAKQRGYATGIMGMPVLPGISDRPQDIDALFSRAVRAGVDFVLCGGLTLRPGAQTESYLAAVEAHDASLLEGYRKLYRQRRASGRGDSRYYARLEQRFDEARRRHGLPGRIPRRIFHGLIPQYTEVAVLMEHASFEQGLGPVFEPARWSLLQWARNRLARERRLLVQELEREFLSMLDDGSIRSLPQMSEEAVELMRKLVAKG